ncbi:hypothetical protein J8273_5407 [Carpediemonas membranifera]|uniref:Uncharacterized protein n=1 Tax=Carpediemonas membranifera TaxID=201153 RepID=A0A8J6B3X9_9EUKA|nr:hypothetical protein J8273_5407 [Carpediemonas membranifera]|eukprot:KAG9392417.1 hypothetical protein J8273_5407 [Carpediemonas membranifera]
MSAIGSMVDKVVAPVESLISVQIIELAASLATSVPKLLPMTSAQAVPTDLPARSASIGMSFHTAHCQALADATRRHVPHSAVLSPQYTRESVYSTMATALGLDGRQCESPAHLHALVKGRQAVRPGAWFSDQDAASRMDPLAVVVVVDPHVASLELYYDVIKTLPLRVVTVVPEHLRTQQRPSWVIQCCIPSPVVSSSALGDLLANLSPYAKVSHRQVTELVKLYEQGAPIISKLRRLLTFSLIRRLDVVFSFQAPPSFDAEPAPYTDRDHGQGLQAGCPCAKAEVESSVGRLRNAGRLVGLLRPVVSGVLRAYPRLKEKCDAPDIFYYLLSDPAGDVGALVSGSAGMVPVDDLRATVAEFYQDARLLLPHTVQSKVEAVLSGDSDGRASRKHLAECLTPILRHATTVARLLLLPAPPVTDGLPTESVVAELYAPAGRRSEVPGVLGFRQFPCVATAWHCLTLGGVKDRDTALPLIARMTENGVPQDQIYESLAELGRLGLVRVRESANRDRDSYEVMAASVGLCDQS